MGDAEWYVDYTNNKCIRNCSPDNLFDPNSDTDVYTDAAYAYECAGLKPESDASWTDIADCCSNRLASLQPTYCAYRSEGGSDSPPNPAVYDGTDEWYADAGNSLCVTDCPTGTGTCGGTVTAASTNLYTSAALCCSSALPWLDSTGCETRSTSGQGTPTNIFWASPNGCRMDCNNDVNCAVAPTSAKLYQTANDCCTKANSWVNLDYCVSRADPAFDESATASSGTDLWFVDYEDGVCREDCNPAGANPACEWADNGSMTFYSTSTDCCSGALGSQNQYACVEASDNGETINTVATDKWYVTSDSDQPCAQDCATGGSNTACGGVIAKTGAKLYDSETECCQQAYAWVNQELCETLSLNVAGAGNKDTDLWYVSYSDDGKCLQISTVVIVIHLIRPLTEVVCFYHQRVNKIAIQQRILVILRVTELQMILVLPCTQLLRPVALPGWVGSMRTLAKLQVKLVLVLHLLISQEQEHGGRTMHGATVCWVSL